jgi:hypothetical protein
MKIFEAWDDTMTDVRYVTKTEYDWAMGKRKKEEERIAAEREAMKDGDPKKAGVKKP